MVGPILGANYKGHHKDEALNVEGFKQERVVKEDGENY
jgi:hypothetical protein